MSIEQELGLGRWFSPDPQDENHLMRSAMPPPEEVELPRSTYWYPGRPGTLNQGRTPQCVGYSAKRWMLASPLPNTKGPSPTQLYYGAQDNDEWAGNDYPGSSVRGVFKFLQQEGHVREYGWAWRAEVVLQWELLYGTVILGTNWYRGMFTPDDSGFVRIGGPIDGGHAYHIIGADRVRGAFRILNSWGDWGENGRAWIAGEDVQRLLDEDGECCTALEVAKSG